MNKFGSTYNSTTNWLFFPLNSSHLKKLRKKEKIRSKIGLQPVYYANGLKPYKTYVQEYVKYLYKFYFRKTFLFPKNANNCKKLPLSK